MNSTPNAFTAFQSDPSDGSNMIEPGDVALVLKRDGTCRAITFGYDRNRLLAPESEHNDDDRNMIEQGRKVFALSVAASQERLMTMLMDISADPDVIDMNAVAAKMRLN